MNISSGKGILPSFKYFKDTGMSNANTSVVTGINTSGFKKQPKRKCVECYIWRIYIPGDVSKKRNFNCNARKAWSIYKNIHRMLIAACMQGGVKSRHNSTFFLKSRLIPYIFIVKYIFVKFCKAWKESCLRGESESIDLSLSQFPIFDW